MPGLTGYLSLGSTTAPPPAMASLTGPLCHERNERVTELALPPGNALAVVDLGIDGVLAGVAVRPDRGLRVAFYGEFDNDGLERARDGEELASKLADLYVRHGEELAWRLRGTFVMFVRDDRKGVSLFINDHYASRPLLFGRVHGRLWFSPELKTFAKIDGGPRVDVASWVAFLVNGHMLNGRTYFEGVRSLSPGSVLRIEDDTFEVVRKHSHTVQGDGTEHGPAYYTEELATLLMDAVRRRLRNTETTVIPISGGWDSRGILACGLKITGAQLRTVSWGTHEEDPHADAAVGRAVAERLGTRHIFLRRQTNDYERRVGEMIERTDGLNEDPAFHAGEMGVIHALRNEHGITHMLRGDECFGFTGHTTSQLEALARIGIYGIDDARPLGTLLRADLRASLSTRYADMLDAAVADSPGASFDDMKDHLYFHQRLRHYLNVSSYYKLTALDVTNPLLDRDVLDFVRRLPTHYRIEKALYKSTLEKMFPELLSVPMASSASLEDWGALIRSDATMQKLLRHHLIESRNGLHDLLEPAALRSYVEAALHPRESGRPHVRTTVIGAVKSVVGVVSPELYQRLKARAMPHVHTRELAPERLVLRLLCAKLWFDRYA